jgi:hypothetical protein
MTDENESNANDQTENSSQVPLSMSISRYQSIQFSFLLEMTLETSNHSTIERHIQNVLRQNFLEQRSITWKPIKVELIVNTQLTDDFFGKYFPTKRRKRPRSNSMFSLAVSKQQIVFF